MSDRRRVTNWKKEVRDAYRAYGAVVLSSPRGRGGGRLTDYRFPDGAVFFIPNDVDQGWAKKQLAVLRERYGSTGPVHRSQYERRGGAPKVDLDRLVASEHAKQRLHEMQEQARSVNGRLKVSCELRDVLYAIRLGTPFWSPVHESWTWEYGDLAVSVVESPVGFTITTVMWSRPELFEALPRVEKAGL